MPTSAVSTQAPDEENQTLTQEPAEGAHSPLCAVGLSHHTAPLDVRSKAALTHEQARELLNVSKTGGIDECVVLSTCNRTEIYFSGGGPERAIELLAEHCRLEPAQLRPHLYVRHCSQAASHLFRVTAGLDSAVLGETEIVAQVKAAWRQAEDAGTTGPLVDLLLRRSLEAGKRVRTETDLCRNVTSTASLAVKTVSDHVGDLRQSAITLIGAGGIARRIARELFSANAQNVTVASRTYEHAVALAGEIGAHAAPFADLPKLLTEADAVIAAVDAPNPIITASDLKALAAARTEAPLLIIDMGVPPNVEAGGDHGFALFDIDRLTAACESNSGLRAASIPTAIAILDEELVRFNEALTVQAAAPTIRALVKRAESIRIRNLNWARERLPSLTEAELRVVEDMARRMMNGMLQAPIESLKGNVSGEHREVAVRLFGLHDADGDEV